MASSSVLGKRQRSAATDRSDASAAQTPSKRRLRSSRCSENDREDPVISPLGSTRAKTAKSTHSILLNAGILPSKRTVPDNTPVKNIQINGLENDENVAPAEFTTPKTQRYRNALPVTPRRRVQVAAKPMTPSTPRTMMMAAPKPANTVYTTARQLFVRSAHPKRLVGRDGERDELNQFLQIALQSNRGGCMYVSGPPGTGKSALIEEVCRGLDGEKRVKVANINCASMTTARDIYGRLIEELCDDSSQVFRKGEVERLRGMFLPKKASTDHLYLVTLDEIDHLLTTDLEILYTFFEWSLQRNSRLVLIGIANALDLTDRFLPRLKAKNLKPQLLPFLPYTPPQITKVITTLLRSLLPSDSVASDDFVPFLQPAAIQLCARKVASQSGDLRKAFDLVRRTLDIVERESLDKANSAPPSPSKAPLAENVNMSSIISPPDTPARKMAEYTAATAPRATVAHVARVTSAAFSNGTTERLQGLNLQQKAALCALVSFARRQRAVQQVPATPTKSPRSNAPTAKQLFDTYSALCRRDNMLHPLTATEFRDILSNLETMGLVGEVQERGRGRAAGGPMGFLTPSRLGRGAGGSPLKNGGRETGLVCFVGEKELETHITGPGEGVLKALLREEL